MIEHISLRRQRFDVPCTIEIEHSWESPSRPCRTGRRPGRPGRRGPCPWRRDLRALGREARASPHGDGHPRHRARTSLGQDDRRLRVHGTARILASRRRYGHDDRKTLAASQGHRRHGRGGHAAGAPPSNTTDFEALDRMDVSPVQKEWDALLQEMEDDPNKGHFKRKRRLGQDRLRRAAIRPA